MGIRLCLRRRGGKKEGAGEGKTSDRQRCGVALGGLRLTHWEDGPRGGRSSGARQQGEHVSKPRWLRGRRRAEKKVGLESRAGKGVDGQGGGCDAGQRGESHKHGMECDTRV